MENADETKLAMIKGYMAKAHRALLSMQRELTAQDVDLAVNRAYFACFYAVTAVLLSDGHEFVRDTALHSAVDQHMVKTGRIPPAMGRFYEELFAGRAKADYEVETGFDLQTATQIAAAAAQFVLMMLKLLDQADQADQVGS